MPDQHINILAIICGVAYIAGAASNWDWFYENWQTKYITRAIGRPLTKLLYGILGVSFIAFGIIRILVGP